MKISGLLILVFVYYCVFLFNTTDASADYLYLKPFDNSACTGSSTGLGYLFIAFNSMSSMIDNKYDYYSPLSTSNPGCLVLSNSTSMKTNIFGEIGLFEFFSGAECTGSPLSNTAFKHNICYQMPDQLSSLLTINSTTTTGVNNLSNLYFQLSFIDSISTLQPILDINYGYRFTQYDALNSNSNSNSNQECNSTDQDLTLLQFITNSFNTIDSNNNNVTFTCNNQRSSMNICNSSSTCQSIPLNQQCIQYLNTYNIQSC